jgi:hypothetical protein
MKNISILLLITFMTFGLSQKQTAQTLNGYWSLICYTNLLTGKQDCLTVTDESQTVSLEFKDNGKIGTMSGHTTTNDVTGDYFISDNNKIRVKNFGGTKVGELPWVYDFWSTISQSSSFKFNGDTLVILFDNDTKAMKFKQLKKKK